MVAHFAPGIDIPLHPFFGSMGVAPPPDFGRYDSTPPTINGGNMDNKELVAGTTLYLPVHAQGALFEVGDGHAGQGNGEVDITAMETSLIGDAAIHPAQGREAALSARRDADPLHRHGLRRRSVDRHPQGGAQHDRLPGREKRQ